jgi:hypothetical protein
MIETKEEMWQHFVSQTPQLGKAVKVTLTIAEIKRIVNTVWHHATVARISNRPLGCDLPPVFDFLRGMRK